MDHRSSRRGVLKVLTAGLGTALAALVTVPGLRMLLGPRGADGSAPPWIPVASLRTLGEGEPRLAQIVGPRRDAWSRQDAVALGACWLVRTGARVRAFGSACPHLGCAVTWNAAGRASGVYVARMEARRAGRPFEESRMMLLVK
jgi:Rieske Fe-S protein